MSSYSYPKKHAYGAAIDLVARPTVGPGVVVTSAVATACTLELFDRSGDLVWTKALTVGADPPTGCLFSSLQNDALWKHPDSTGYTFAYKLVPGTLDDASTALDLKAGRVYIAKATFTTDGGADAWPLLADYGPAVYTWDVEIDSTPSS